ncbi:hypothetical protein ACK3Y5_17355, partial [Aeromonas caviae]
SEEVMDFKCDELILGKKDADSRALTDYRRHMDYIHINPLKHGHVSRVADWPYSTFHRYVASGIYPPDWCGSVDGPLGGLE